MAANHNGQNWPYHLSKKGEMVPCSTNPCSLHGGSDVYATSPQEAFVTMNNNAVLGLMGMENAAPVKEPVEETPVPKKKKKAVKKKAVIEETPVMKESETQEEKEPDAPLGLSEPSQDDHDAAVKKLVEEGVADMKAHSGWHQHEYGGKAKKGFSDYVTTKSREAHAQKELKVLYYKKHEQEMKAKAEAEAKAKAAAKKAEQEKLEKATIQERIKLLTRDKEPSWTPDTKSFLTKHPELDIRGSDKVHYVKHDFGVKEAMADTFGAEAKTLSEEEAKKRGSAAWKKLTKEEKESIRFFTGSGYSAINKNLQGKETNATMSVVEANTKLIHSALGKSVTSEDIILHRTRFIPENSTRRSHEEEAFYKAVSSGADSVVKPNFSSTSINVSHNETAPKYIIKVPKGTPGIYVGEHSNFGSEREYLLDKNLEYKVVSIYERSAAVQSGLKHTSGWKGYAPIICLEVVPPKKKATKKKVSLSPKKND